MKFRTEIEIPHSPWQIAYTDKIALLGSCFSDNIARKLGEYYFQVTANPTGTLYNPVSIARHMDDEAVRDADVFIITFGTSWVYVDKALATVVDNCEKRPATDFIRRRLTVDEIVEIWQPILAAHPDKRFIFTVSPIRHLKDGLHENNLSKAILLLAIERLTGEADLTAQRSNFQQAKPVYFESFEILLDDLRDYRFYADDLMHPSSAAVDYIWERFVPTFFSDATQREMKELHSLWLNRNHRSLCPNSPEDLQFKARTAEQFRALKLRYPWIP
ncbi:MAG: GSCFA domain-containing protein [Paludibacteraceae bacterium]|nr:GSCFA domain-containing protein [Paludibacteraceae bacterium]